MVENIDVPDEIRVRGMFIIPSYYYFYRIIVLYFIICPNLCIHLERIKPVVAVAGNASSVDAANSGAQVSDTIVAPEADTSSAAQSSSTSSPSETINPIVKDAALANPSSDEYLIPNPSLPSMIRTWARRKKRENKTLKTYYFVLERGTLSMFKDSREEPPYGHGHKGDIFLANFRASKSDEAGEECVVVLSRQFSSSGDPADSEKPPPSQASSATASNDASRGSLYDGTRPILILFVDQKSRDKWLSMFRQHISWATAHREDEKPQAQGGKSRLSWIPSPFSRK